MKKLVLFCLLTVMLVCSGLFSACGGGAPNDPDTPKEPLPPDAPATYEITAPKSSMVIGEFYTIPVDFEVTDDLTITYQSSAPEFATVDESGKIEAIKVGETTITRKVNDYSDSFDLSVVTGGYLPSVEFVNALQETNNVLTEGTLTVKALAKFNGKIYEDGTVTYELSNTAVGSVDQTTGVFTATTTAGTTELTVTVSWRGFEEVSETITIEVTKPGPAFDYEIVDPVTTLILGESWTIPANYGTEGITSVTYASSATDVATVDTNGKIETLKTGTTTITRTINGEYSDSFELSVVISVITDGELFIVKGIAEDVTSVKLNDAEITAETAAIVTAKESVVSTNKMVDLETLANLYNGTELLGSAKVSVVTKIIDEISDLTAVNFGKAEITGYYLLANDITYGDTAETQYFTAGVAAGQFTGTFDGNGYTLEVGINGARGLLGNLNEGTVIKDISIKIKDTSKQGLGRPVLCGSLDGSEVNPVIIENVYIGFDVDFAYKWSATKDTKIYTGLSYTTADPSYVNMKNVVMDYSMLTVPAPTALTETTAVQQKYFFIFSYMNNVAMNSFEDCAIILNADYVLYERAAGADTATTMSAAVKDGAEVAGGISGLTHYTSYDKLGDTTITVNGYTISKTGVTGGIQAPVEPEEPENPVNDLGTIITDGEAFIINGSAQVVTSITKEDSSAFDFTDAKASVITNNAMVTLADKAKVYNGTELLGSAKVSVVTKIIDEISDLPFAASAVVEGYYLLANDITWGDTTETQYYVVSGGNANFTGTFDGNGYTIELGVSGARGLMGNLNEGTVVKNLSIKVKDTSKQKLGRTVLCGSFSASEANPVLIENVYIGFDVDFTYAWNSSKATTLYTGLSFTSQDPSYVNMKNVVLDYSSINLPPVPATPDNANKYYFIFAYMNNIATDSFENCTIILNADYVLYDRAAGADTATTMSAAVKDGVAVTGGVSGLTHYTSYDKLGDNTITVNGYTVSKTGVTKA